MKTELLANDPASVLRAAKLLALGEVVALPTETVYGLAGNAFREDAVQKIFSSKERPSFDPLIVHISEKYLNHPRGLIPALVEDGILKPEILSSPDLLRIHAVMKHFWPGPLTFILPRGPKIPDSVTASQPSVGLRCPAHPVFQAVLSKLDFPLAAPSANRFGRISPTSASHVATELDGRIAAILDGGACSIGVESTIIKIDFPFRVTLLRPGKISREELAEEFQGKVHYGATAGEVKSISTVSPGLLDEHYAPSKPLYLMPNAFSDLEATEKFLTTEPMPKKLGILSMTTLSKELKGSVHRTLSDSNDLVEMAQSLFRVMRELDENQNVDAILADLPLESKSGLGAAIADRLRRASRNKPPI